MCVLILSVYLNNACVVRTAEETEEYQRVATNVGKGLSVIQEELHRMRMATKAQVDSLALQREVNHRVYDISLYVNVGQGQVKTSNYKLEPYNSEAEDTCRKGGREREGG